MWPISSICRVLKRKTSDLTAACCSHFVSGCLKVSLFEVCTSGNVTFLDLLHVRGSVALHDLTPSFISTWRCFSCCQIYFWKRKHLWNQSSALRDESLEQTSVPQGKCSFTHSSDVHSYTEAFLHLFIFLQCDPASLKAALLQATPLYVSNAVYLWTRRRKDQIAAEWRPK